MNFVDGDRRCEPVFLGAMGDPLGIGPVMMIEPGDNRAGFRAQFGAEAVGISFERKNVAVGADNFVFVDGAFVELGKEDFPKTGRAACAHGMDSSVPPIEVAYDADAPG